MAIFGGSNVVRQLPHTQFHGQVLAIPCYSMTELGMEIGLELIPSGGICIL